MSWSRFITVENLCIAAEVTAAMLLLAFAIPEKYAKVKSPSDDEGDRALLELARRAFLEEKIAQCLSRLALLETSRPDVDCTERLGSEFSDAEKLGWLDRVSGAYNRSFLDLFLKRWLALPSENRLGSYLSMVSLKDYSELVRALGPVQVELMLRDLGNRLKDQFADHAIVARLPPDRFLVITFDADPSVGVKCVESASVASTDPNAAPETQSKPLALVSSVVALTDELPSFEDAVSQLEAGAEAAIKAGESYFIKRDTQWTSEIPAETALSRSSSLRAKARASASNKPKSAPSAETAVDEQSAASSPNTSGSATENENDSKSEATSKSNGGEELDPLGSNTPDAPAQVKSADVSAVASNEEIAALFAQIKKNENQSGKSQDAAVDGATTAASTSTPGASSDGVANKDADDTVSADDIASLFAASKPTSKPKQEIAAAEPSTQTSRKSAANKDADDTVSADDIASLFAAAKPTSKPKQETAAAEPSTQTSRKSAANKDADDTVSADDIASLFAAAKPTSKPKQETAAAEPSTQTSRKSAANKDADDTVSADDIASLFAAAKPVAAPKTKPAELPNSQSSSQPQPAAPLYAQNPAEANKKSTGIAELDSMADTASADDISALFKAVQQENKDSGASPVRPTPPANNRFAKEIEDLSESATSVDIAELFKAVQTGLGAAKTSGPSSPSASIEELGESATSDDIAELFATVRQESKPKEVTTPSNQAVAVAPKQDKAPVAPEDLQETASSDDIASLFAQMKPTP
jgi:GGDEF domain-containing protein